MQMRRGIEPAGIVKNRGDISITETRRAGF
jgi:hypothetical protein